ncbi:MAG: ACT domain-containing protein [Pseudomonadota bacterium]
MQTGFVRELQAMLSGMEPALDADPYVFVHASVGDPAALAVEGLFATIVEDEGLTVIARFDPEADHGAGPHFARITLQVHSALEGVGLTAAVATGLAAEGIACNVVAAFHHDHLFVPWDRREDALAVLKQISREVKN